MTTDPGLHILDFLRVAVTETTLMVRLKRSELFYQFDHCKNHLDGIVHLPCPCHKHKYSFHSVFCLILLEHPIIVEINFEQLCESLKRVQTPIEVLEDYIAPIFFFYFLRVNFTVFLLDQLDEVLQLNICIHFISCDSFQCSVSLQNYFNRLFVFPTLQESVIQI